MKKNLTRFLILATAFVIFSVFIACASPPERVEARPDIHGLISRIEYGGNVAYILGSMHLGRPEWFPLNPVVEDAMARADVFAFEVDMALMGSPEIVMHTSSLMMLPGGLTLQDILPPEAFTAFLESLEVLPTITYEMVANFTPIGAMLIITMVELMPLMGIFAEYSVDDYVNAFALANDRPVIGLNDIFRELDLVFNIPMDIQVTMFDSPADWDDVDWAADWDEMIQSVVDMGLVEAYEAGDIAMLRDAMSSSLSDDPTPFEEYFHHVNFHTRCHIFADEIARLLRETAEPTTFFVTIGVAHIIGGDFGKVLTLLEGQGFDVVPLWR